MSVPREVVAADDGSALTPDVAPDALEAPPGPPDETPDLHRLASLLGEGQDIRTIALVGLLVLAVVYTLYFAASLLLPIVLAIVLDFLLSPAVRWLRKLRIPTAIGAALIVFGMLGVVGFTTYRLAGPAAEWIHRGPESIARVRGKLDRLRRPVEQVTNAAKQVEQATKVSGSDATPKVEIAGPSLVQQLFGGTMNFLSQALTVVFLGYFLLASTDLFLTKLIRMLPQFKDKRRAVEIAREMEAQISVFIVTSTLIGIGVGVATTIALYFVGLPNAVLWGVVAFLLNYIPYIGNLITIVLLAMAGLLTFDSTWQALLGPAIFFGINIVEGNIVTPMLMGKRLELNTVAVFIGLMFWWQVWGITGAILAVPMLAIMKIVCDRVESLAPIGEFLGE